MNKFDFSGLMKKVQRTLSQHSPEILTGLGVAGMFTTTVLAVKATPKALEEIALIEIPEDAESSEPTFGQKFKATWKYYVPAAITAGVSTACIIGANTVNSKRNAALATAYQLSQSALVEYKEKVIETIGEKKEKKIKDAIVKDHIDEQPPASAEVIIASKDGVLCYEDWSGRYFKIHPEKLAAIENELNAELISCMYVSLNTFFDKIGLPPTKQGDSLGWNIDSGLVKLEKSYIGAEDGTPCIGISFNIEPRYEYYRLG